MQEGRDATVADSDSRPVTKRRVLGAQIRQTSSARKHRLPATRRLGAGDSALLSVDSCLGERRKRPSTDAP